MNDVGSNCHLSDPRPLRGSFDLLSDPSLILRGIAGFDGKLKFLNPAWENILGYRREELLDRSLCELMSQQEHPAAAALVNQLLADVSIEPIQFGLRCKDGTYKWFLWHWRLDPEDRAIFIAGYDITEQKTRQIASLLRSYDRSTSVSLAP